MLLNICLTFVYKTIREEPLTDPMEFITYPEKTFKKIGTAKIF